MCETMLTQLLKLNLGYEVLIEQFIKNLMEFPGAHVRVPMPVHKGQTIDAWNDEKHEIITRTSEVLTMMGIEHVHGSTDYTLMIKDPQ